MPAIPLDNLHSHPHNANVMPEPLFKKLTSHIQRTGHYPPIIVCPISDASGLQCYQILDGHHRVAALRRLEFTSAECVVWSVDETEALTLVASLNRLQGGDDPAKRGELIHELTQTLDWKSLVARLPEDQPKLKKLLELHREPATVTPPEPIEWMPVAVHFFLAPAKRTALEARLRAQGGPREQALLELVGLA